MRQIARKYWKHIAFVGALFSIFFAVQAGKITRGPQPVSKRPVQIGEPLVLVRDGICLPGELKVVCNARVP